MIDDQIHQCIVTSTLQEHCEKPPKTLNQLKPWLLQYTLTFFHYDEALRQLQWSTVDDTHV